ncbi:MAG: hypothetical protein JF616_12145 [Fibrobacteres bacterium]|nr:hypothetical protein [Fibrobacterota bacterium]
MPRTCLVFAFAIASLLILPGRLPAQPNSQQSSQLPGPAPQPPTPPKAVKDSVKAARAKSKKAKSPVADTTRTGASSAAAAKASTAPAGSPAGVKDSLQTSSQATAPVAPPLATDSAKAKSSAPFDSNKAPADVLEAKPEIAKVEPKRLPPDLRLFNDPPLIGREYGFGILGSVVASTLGFFIGSGIETAIVGESRAHKGTLSFTGIRYDNFKGAFWGGSSGMVLGSALTIYFTGQTEEEDGGLFATLAGTTAAAAGAFYLASLMGVNDDVDWKPFIPLLAVPSLGGALGFNVSRWFHDRQREEVVGKEAAIRLHAPSLAFGLGPRGERVEIRALRLTF